MNVLLDEYEKGFDMETLDQFFGELKEHLVPLLKEVTEKSGSVRDDFLTGDFPDEAQRACLRRVGGLSTEAVGMSDRLEHALAPYVTFLVMPIFALANAGVVIESAAYFDIFHRAPETGAVGMGVFFGLLAGKPLGIFLASWCAVRTGLAAMPEGATWRMLLAVACLGGIGFTMSLFVDSLAFSDPGLVDRGKIAILMGSAAAAAVGSLLIVMFGKKRIR